MLKFVLNYFEPKIIQYLQFLVVITEVDIATPWHSVLLRPTINLPLYTVSVY